MQFVLYSHYKKQRAGVKGHQNNPKTPGIGPCQERSPAPSPPPFPQVLMVYQKCMIKVFDRSYGPGAKVSIVIKK